MKCPVCDSPMELVTVVRKAKGSAQAIKCPECRTSTFLTKEAAARLQAAKDAPSVRPTPTMPEPKAAPRNTPIVAPTPEALRVPTSFFEDFIEWLNS